MRLSVMFIFIGISLIVFGFIVDYLTNIHHGKLHKENRNQRPFLNDEPQKNETEPTRVCKSCGAVIPYASKFCSYCGIENDSEVLISKTERKIDDAEILKAKLEYEYKLEKLKHDERNQKFKAIMKFIPLLIPIIMWIIFQIMISGISR